MRIGFADGAWWCLDATRSGVGDGAGRMATGKRPVTHRECYAYERESYGITSGLSKNSWVV
jgi:hypothetical protein